MTGTTRFRLAFAAFAVVLGGDNGTADPQHPYRNPASVCIALTVKDDLSGPTFTTLRAEATRIWLSARRHPHMDAARPGDLRHLRADRVRRRPGPGTRRPETSRGNGAHRIFRARARRLVSAPVRFACSQRPARTRASWPKANGVTAEASSSAASSLTSLATCCWRRPRTPPVD